MTKLDAYREALHEIASAILPSWPNDDNRGPLTTLRRAEELRQIAREALEKHP